MARTELTSFEKDIRAIIAKNLKYLSGLLKNRHLRKRDYF